MISIIIPIFNREEFILDTLNSIKDQSYSDWECIIIDDGSTDNSKLIVQNIIANDNRFFYYQRPNYIQKGPSGCRNYGFNLSKGDFIHWFDSDDIMLGNNLLKKIEKITKTKSDLIVCEMSIFNSAFPEIIERTTSIKYSIALEDYLLGNIAIWTQTPLWRKSFLMRKQLFDARLCMLEDMEFIARMLNSGAMIETINEPLIKIRRGEKSLTQEFFDDPGKHIDSFLEVKKRLLSLDRNNKTINVAINREVLYLLRRALNFKDYSSCIKCLNFIKINYYNKNSILFKLSVLKFNIFYLIFKIVKKGNTRFKNVLSIRIN